MRLTKAFYFLYYAAGAALMPFLALYYKQNGLSGPQIGVLSSIPSLMSFVGAPLWGGLADATRRHKTVLLVAIGGTLLTVLLLSATTTFFWLAPVVALYALCISPIMPLVDSSTVDLLGEHKDQYGKLRLWGALGWGIAAPLLGWLIERSGLRGAFFGYVILMGTGLVVAWRLPIGQASIRHKFWSGLRLMVTDWRWLVFSGAALVGGICSAMINSYLFLYLDSLGAGETLMGLALTFATFGELPVFFFSDRLLVRFGSRGVLLLSLLAYAVRTLGYSLIQVPWMALPVQLLNGMTFSAMWVAGITFADEMAPEGMEATAQGLFSGVMFGLGGTVGALLGGVLYEGLGAALMYRYAGVGMLVGAGLFALASRRLAGSKAGQVV